MMKQKGIINERRITILRMILTVGMALLYTYVALHYVKAAPYGLIGFAVFFALDLYFLKKG